MLEIIMMKIFRKMLQLYQIYIKWRKYSFGKNLHAGRAVQNNIGKA
mgnify:CR=1 FL=1